MAWKVTLTSMSRLSLWAEPGSRRVLDAFAQLAGVTGGAFVALLVELSAPPAACRMGDKKPHMVRVVPPALWEKAQRSTGSKMRGGSWTKFNLLILNFRLKRNPNPVRCACPTLSESAAPPWGEMCFPRRGRSCQPGMWRQRCVSATIRSAWTCLASALTALGAWPSSATCTVSALTTPRARPARPARPAPPHHPA